LTKRPAPNPRETGGGLEEITLVFRHYTAQYKQNSLADGNDKTVSYKTIFTEVGISTNGTTLKSQKGEKTKIELLRIRLYRHRKNDPNRFTRITDGKYRYYPIATTTTNKQCMVGAHRYRGPNPWI